MRYIKYIFLIFFLINTIYSQVHVILDKDIYIIYTNHYVVSFNESNIYNGLTINNYYIYSFIGNNEDLLKPISLKQATYDIFSFEILTNFGKYKLTFYENYFTITGIKTSKYLKQKNKISLTNNGLLKVIKTNNLLILLNGKFNDGYGILVKFNKKRYNKSTYEVHEDSFSFEDPPNKEFNYLLYPFYAGYEKYGDLKINEKYFTLPNVSTKTTNIVEFIKYQLKIDDKKKEMFYNVNVFPLLYIKKVCINSNLICQIYVNSVDYGIYYFNRSKWIKIIIKKFNNTKNKKELYKEPIANYLYVKENSLNSFLFSTKEFMFIGEKDTRILLITFILVLTTIIYFVMHLLNKYYFKYYFTIRSQKYNGKYEILKNIEENENKLAKRIYEYIKNKGHVDLNIMENELKISKQMIKLYVDYLIKKGYIKKVGNNG